MNKHPLRYLGWCMAVCVLFILVQWCSFRSPNKADAWTPSAGWDVGDFDSVPSNLIPSVDDTYDVGSSTKEWQDGYFDGTVYTDALTVGAAASISEAEMEILDGATLSTTDINIIDGISDSGSLTAAELLYVDGVTSAIQTQLDGKEAATTLTSDESADAALTTLGQIHVRGDEDRVSYHAGAGGEVAGEVTVSVLEMVAASMDPGTWYDSDTEAFLMEVHADVYPNGIIIDEWKVSCNCDPDTEINADLRYADDWIALTNAADIDEIDTINGVSTEDTDSNINSGTAVAAGKVVYIGFDADPEGTCTQMQFTMIFHAEED